MIRAAALLFALLAAAAPLAASETIVAGLSQNRVSITANYDGSEILIYGAVRRAEPAPEGPPLEVIVTVEGPSTPLVIRRKEKTLGIWLNRDEVTIDAAPSFYAVATTGPLSRVLSSTEDLRHRITLDHAIRAVGIAAEAADSPEFVTALKRIRLADDRYRLAEGAVYLVEQTLFRADIVLPANLTEGDYRVRMFLTRSGRVIDSQERVINVRKEGVERFLYLTAHKQPLLYGIASLILAAVAGWAASAGFRMLRR